MYTRISLCEHGNNYYRCVECEEDDRLYGDVDKCLRCGRYVASNSLNNDQVCSHGCTNPDEY